MHEMQESVGSARRLCSDGNPMGIRQLLKPTRHSQAQALPLHLVTCPVSESTSVRLTSEPPHDADQLLHGLADLKLALSGSLNPLILPIWVEKLAGRDERRSEGGVDRAWVVGERDGRRLRSRELVLEGANRLVECSLGRAIGVPAPE